jgi:type IV secretory pathway VirB10-like protein
MTLTLDSEPTTSPLPAPAPSQAPTDAHQSKIAPDDPRLRLGRPRGRTLRKGPAVALAAGLAGVVLISLVIALEPNGNSRDKGAQTSTTPTSAVVPDAIRFAADKPPVSGPPVHAGPHEADAGAAFPPPGARREPTRSMERYSAENRKQLDEEQAWKARGSGVLFEATGAREGFSPESPPLSDAPSNEPATKPSAVSGGLAPNGSEDPNFQDRKNAFLDRVGGAKTQRAVGAVIEKPISPYEVKAGSIIPAVLLTAINSDLPGPVIGQVRENVYDTVTGNYLLIPQGSRILAAYDSNVSWGQERVLVCWNRLIYPNGDSIRLDCMPAGDLAGAAGLTDEVNEHWGRLIKGAAISTLLAATSQAVAGNTEGFVPTVPQMWARGAATEVNQIGQRLTARNLNIQPTITVRPGYAVNVMVTKDLVVRPYPSSSGRSTFPPAHPG